MTFPQPSDPTTMATFSVRSEPGNERQATEQVARAVAPLGLDPSRIEKLKTAVAEATMNAMEHGNQYRADAPVLIELLASDEDISVRITDEGESPVPSQDPQAPDLEAKLEGLQTPRGWGLFLIKNMVDEMRVTGDESHHTVELIMHRQPQEEGGK